MAFRPGSSCCCLLTSPVSAMSGRWAVGEAVTRRDICQRTSQSRVVGRPPVHAHRRHTLDTKGGHPTTLNSSSPTAKQTEEPQMAGISSSLPGRRSDVRCKAGLNERSLRPLPRPTTGFAQKPSATSDVLRQHHQLRLGLQTVCVPERLALCFAAIGVASFISPLSAARSVAAAKHCSWTAALCAGFKTGHRG